MIGRLEVTAGPGTVIRFGSVAAWASSAASSHLVSFLSQSARNLAQSPAGGRQLADHLAGVLSNRDPEPQVPFVVIGPGPDGWVALLHGPVQVWDGSRWTSSDPHPGWVRSELQAKPSIAVTVAGGPVPVPSPDQLLDLEAGVVPGSGFVLHPRGGARTTPGGPSRPATVAPNPLASGPPATETAVMPAVEASAPPPGEAVERQPGPGPDPAPPGVVDLRNPDTLERFVDLPPLPEGAAADPSRPIVTVAGVVCARGHLNRSGMTRCARCGQHITPGAAGTVEGTRPGLGCLVLDNGSAFRLDRPYVVGSSPGSDPGVRSGRAAALVLIGEGVAPAHAELGLDGWDVSVTDRSSPSGTHLFEPGGGEWRRIPPYRPRILRPGTHLAFGQRVVTYLSPWTAGR